MNLYLVTFKRTETFYQDIIVEASTQEEAREKADLLSIEGVIEFDYFQESEVLDEYILEIEKI